ncbi:type II secretion system GspH family protein [Jeotgalibaca sp. MA1X17-3]|uniref:type II secretion system protein n=1 Tax=Jeotgalibaca sp. MA1X17-3 TaxID=2908211 RepID=UPI001F24B189|nr:type II secretion system protein [Jeotgalibaca sp. MA1X17-3]UJF14835.1 type II secretion system GspH family protein [Jeotgalibaca sp. MA1X17-3]
MRNKIKQLLKKEEGFTLIELLGVIVILGLIIAIAIPSIGGIVKKAGDDTDKAQEALIIDAAQMYFIQNPEDEDGQVTVDELTAGGYLESKVKTDTTTINKFDVMEGLEAPNN